MPSDGPSEPKHPPPSWLKRKTSFEESIGLPTKAPKLIVASPKASAPEIPESNEEALLQATSSSSGLEVSLKKGDSWREFEDVDPYYALLGELSQNKVFGPEGQLHEDRLSQYLERLFCPGVVQKNKDWVEVWAAMSVPIDSQAEVLQPLLQVGLSSEVSDAVPDILAELIKGHRTKIKAVEEAVMTLFECGSDDQGCLARFLLLIFPKSPTSEWGWSRVGWSWQQWWGTTERILSALDASSAYETLCNLLRQLESDSGTYLPHQQIWDEHRLSKVRAALCSFGGLVEDELAGAFDVTLS